jgi:hypothetical protein
MRIAEDLETIRIQDNCSTLVRFEDGSRANLMDARSHYSGMQSKTRPGL